MVKVRTQRVTKQCRLITGLYGVHGQDVGRLSWGLPGPVTAAHVWGSFRGLSSRDAPCIIDLEISADAPLIHMYDTSGRYTPLIRCEKCKYFSTHEGQIHISVSEHLKNDSLYTNMCN